jgi:zinc/manganese transport system substrate-binding protein
VAVTLAGVAAACSSTSSTANGRVQVVAAENVYGDIAAQLGGRLVDVTSIISSPTADPHLYQPTTQNAAAVGGADLVIENGLGYDAFLDRLLSSTDASHRTVITVADVLHKGGAGANPHLWYDVPELPLVARAITNALVAEDPGHRSYFRQRLQQFDGSLRPLQQAVARIEANAGGAPVAYTEPVAGYLLEAAGLSARTPETFARAIEEGNDPSPQSVSEMGALLANHRVELLLYNSQATSPITRQLRSLAASNGIPVVAVTETLPVGLSFQEWQLRQVDAIAKALGV